MNLLERIKRHPVYVKWHFELGILVLFVGLTLVAAGLIQLDLRQSSASSELRRHDAEIAAQARAGALAHRALCAQRASILHALKVNRSLLPLSPEERARRVGLGGSISTSLLRTSIAGELRTLRSYAGLRC